jgi:hypothetical protein
MLKSHWLLFLLAQSVILASQSKEDYNWQLGTKSDPTSHTSPVSLELSFNNNERMIRTFYRPLYMGHFNASISDDDGNLLLYSNGCQINDGNHDTISGSSHLNPGSIDQEWCGQVPGSYPVAEGGLFLPFFEDSIIILLHQRLSVTGLPLVIYVDALFYTLLKISGHSYSIIEKSTPVIQDSLTYGRLEAIRGEKEGYWWVIQGIRNSNKYFTIGFDSGRIDTSFFQIIGDATVKKGEGAAQSAFSPDGKSYARYAPADDLFLFDFDISSGVLSNYQKFHVADSGSIGGLAFSPNSRFLYACSVQDLYQFDISVKNIKDTKTHIGHYDGFVSFFPATFYYMQLGPDCKIYMIPPNGIDVMHVINSPDKKGLDCDFEQHGFILPTYNTITIPNFPVFIVFPDAPCDPNISTFILETVDINSDLKIYPNPTKGVINIDLDDNSTFGTIQVKVIDLSGYMHIDKEVEYSKSFQLDLSILKGGIYIIQIQDNIVIRYSKIVKMD